METGMSGTALPDHNQESILNYLITLLNTEGHSHFEEMVTQYQHAVQTAHLAKNSGADAQLITAALLHDIGHLLVSDESDEFSPVMVTVMTVLSGSESAMRSGQRGPVTSIT